MQPSAHFHGFSLTGINFLRNLSANNNREWFQSNQPVYERELLEPARAFVVDLGERLKELSPGVQFDASSKTAGSILRIHRDVRFSRDKTPYHTHLRLVLWEGPLKRMENPSYFLVFEPDRVTVHAGHHEFSPAVLQAYRQAVAAESTGSQLEALLGKIVSGGNYQVGGQGYKKVPAGYPADHPRAGLLKFNGLYASTHSVPPAMLTEPGLVDACFECCRVLAPLQRWLVELWESV